MSKREDRTYQKTAVSKCVRELNKSGRTQLLMAPGCGKTVVSLMIKEQLKPKITLFFVPSIQLIYQQYLSWASFNDNPYEVLTVTSGRMSNEDKVIIKKLKYKHAGTTTDVKEIKKFIDKKTKKSKLIYSTYRSASKLVCAFENKEVDYAVFDEAHHVAGDCDKNATALLHDDQIKINRRLFMTATPKMCKDNEESLTAATMDNEELFGKVGYKLSIKQAINREILVDYVLYAAAVTEKEIKQVKGNYKREEKISAAAIKKAFENNVIYRGLTFHNRTEKANKFSLVLKNILDNCYVDTLNASHKMAHRQKSIKQLIQSNQGVITNVGILGEGFDCKQLDFIVFVDDKNSVTDIVQNIGRIMRKDKNKDKKKGIIIIPVVIDEDTDVSSLVLDGQYKQIYKIVTSLGYLDDLLGSEISKGRATADTVKTPYFISHVRTFNKSLLDRDQINKIKDRIQMYALYGSKGARMSKDSEMLDELTAFCEKHKRLPSYYKKDEAYLHNFFNRLSIKTTEKWLVDALTIIKEKYGSRSRSIEVWDQSIKNLLERVEKDGFLSVHGGNEQDNEILSTIKYKRIPNFAEELFQEQITIIKNTPSVKEYELQQKLNQVVILEQWCEEYGRLPTREDVGDCYDLLRRRRAYRNKEMKERIQSLVDKYNYGADTLDGKEYEPNSEEKRKFVYRKHEQKLKELEEFIQNNNRYPRFDIKSERRLRLFMDNRLASKSTSQMLKDLINEVRDRNKHLLKHRKKAS